MPGEIGRTVTHVGIFIIGRVPLALRKCRWRLGLHWLTTEPRAAWNLQTQSVN